MHFQILLTCSIYIKQHNQSNISKFLYVMLYIYIKKMLFFQNIVSPPPKKTRETQEWRKEHIIIKRKIKIKNAQWKSMYVSIYLWLLICIIMCNYKDICLCVCLFVKLYKRYYSTFTIQYRVYSFMSMCLCLCKWVCIWVCVCLDSVEEIPF